MKTYIVVPALNEAKRIEQVIKDLRKKNLPIIVVDDGSRDNTSFVAKKVGAVAVRHRVNLGKGAALKTGAEAAFLRGAEAVIFVDADGQHKASDLDKFVNALEGKYDIVFGSRNYSKGVPLVRFLGNKFASVVINVMFGIYVSDLICGYRGLTKKAFKKIAWESRGYDVETEMVIKAGKQGLKYCEVNVETVYLDKFKGVSLLDSFGVLFNVLKWRVTK